MFCYLKIVNETYFTARKSVVWQQIVRFQTKLDDLRISQDICYVRMTDIAGALTIYGHRANLLHNNAGYMFNASLLMVENYMDFLTIYVDFDNLLNKTTVMKAYFTCFSVKITLPSS